MTFEPWVIGVAILLYSLLLVFLSYKIGAHRTRKDLIIKLTLIAAIFEQFQADILVKDIIDTINSIK